VRQLLAILCWSAWRTKRLSKQAPYSSKSSTAIAKMCSTTYPCASGRKPIGLPSKSYTGIRRGAPGPLPVEADIAGDGMPARITPGVNDAVAGVEAPAEVLTDGGAAALPGLWGQFDMAVGMLGFGVCIHLGLKT
jgi:hypothetical protein